MADAEASQSPTSSGQLKKLHGHVPVGALKNMKDQGKADEGQQMSITVALALNNQDDLNQQLSQMYTPGSATYHKFMTPDEFRANYAPTQNQIEQVKNYLVSEGIVPSSVDDNQYLVHATGSAKAINTAFHTEVHNYTDAQGKSYFAPAYEIQTDAKMPIQSVVGLSNINQAHSHAIQKKTDQSTTKAASSGTPPATPKDGSGPDQGLSPTDIRTAYNTPTSVNGSGQTLAVFELDGYDPTDITAYEQQFGLPNVPLQNVLVDSAPGQNSGSAEVTLDIELEIALAPGASKILVYEGPNGDQGIIDTYARIANDNQAKEIGTSWGSSEQGSSASTLQAENTIFQQMAAQGQSIMSAAGDNGANDNGSSLSVDDPSSQPYVTGVGGTSLTIGSGSAYVSETTWDDGGGAGGGGVSGTWSIPSWQSAAGIVTAATLGSTTMRNVPDVSLEADTNNGYSIYWQGGWSVWGGTSCAAPLWAAYTALVNQQRQANNKGDIGFINPAIYSIGTGSRYSSDFHDIADNSNNGHYPAVKGYDDATGWGSFNGENLFQDLVND